MSRDGVAFDSSHEYAETLPRQDPEAHREWTRTHKPAPALEGRDDDTGVLRSTAAPAMPTMAGHWAVFDSWTTINSYEGNFLERVAPGAFSKTFAKDDIKSIFQHGRDPQIGEKPLGAYQALREDNVGAYYEVPLLDTAYNRERAPGLEQGLYGASFRFPLGRTLVRALQARRIASTFSQRGDLVFPTRVGSH